MEWIKLIGILVIILGFIFKFDTLATVIIAGLATALVSGISIPEFLEILGKAYSDQRVVSLFFISLPMIGLTEVFGLKQQAIKLISRFERLTTGGLYNVYMLIRLIAGLLSIRLGGHPQFVRPLIYPMGQAAADVKTGGQLTDKEIEKIKARAAATENFGNFFGQNTFLGSAGVLLIGGTLASLGYKDDFAGIAFAAIPVAIIAMLAVFAYNVLLDMQLKKNLATAGSPVDTHSTLNSDKEVASHPTASTSAKPITKEEEVASQSADSFESDFESELESDLETTSYAPKSDVEHKEVD